MLDFGIAVVALTWNYQLVVESWQQLFPFVLLLALSRISTVQLNSGIEFSVGFIIELVIIQLFGLEIAVLTSFFTMLVVNIIGGFLGSSKKVVDGFISACLVALTISISGFLYQVIPNHILGFIAATVAYFIVYVSLLVGYNYGGFRKGNSYSHNWVEHGKEISLNYFVLAPLAFLIPYVFNAVENQNKILFVLLFFVPVLLVSYSYRLYINIRNSYLNTVKTIVAAIEAKAPYVKGHADRVANYALAIAREMGYSDKALTRLQYLALLHDAGKIGIRDYILKKPGPLTSEEFESVKEHSVIGEGIIRKIKFLSSGADIVRHHHERFDGMGYPDGLQGYDIPEGARILAVADAFDAMTTDRPYKAAKSKAEAIAELDELAGSLFDPRIVELFKKILFRQGEV